MLRRDYRVFSSLFLRLQRQAALLGTLLLAGLAVGCTPKIGDECTTSTNCSASGDRLCDITQPGGYCTVFNCEPGSCPDGSLCINFGTQLSSVDQCSLSQGNSPYQRSFCMASCSNNGDCRGGYACLDLSGKLNADGTPSNTVGAVLADDHGDGKVCAVEPVAGAPDPHMASGVCTGDPDAGRPVSPSGAGGASGANAGGDSGAAGANEAGAGGSAG